ncbi:hypothetical protein K505DRAFT_39032 [Melanomma pulvis-pyrius CBS 109.77]|uniref:Uncharacterized protein n=1 Tax=Melanomma pulvis-pyrius CBS 109.77 TaxID=1314802 RepID=A0A6A6XB66_9PLEO|nr:hypothetical protein K505DRAFT_39032 [Melanomma pulvis-pyrius CBS 109.77]
MLHTSLRFAHYAYISRSIIPRTPRVTQAAEKLPPSASLQVQMLTVMCILHDAISINTMGPEHCRNAFFFRIQNASKQIFLPSLCFSGIAGCICELWGTALGTTTPGRAS